METKQMSTQDNSDWYPCSEGTLESTIDRVRSRRRKVNSIRLVASVVAGSLIFAIVSIYSSTNPPALDCYGASGLFAGYIAGELDQESLDLVEQHLAICEKCRMKLRGLQANESVSKVRFVRLHRCGSEFLLNTIHSVPLSVD